MCFLRELIWLKEDFSGTWLNCGVKVRVRCLKLKVAEDFALGFFKKKLKIINKTCLLVFQWQLASVLICVMTHYNLIHFISRFASFCSVFWIILLHDLSHFKVIWWSYSIAFCNEAWKKGKHLHTFPVAKIINLRGECKSCSNLIDKQGDVHSVFIHNPYKIIQKSCFSVTPI